MIQISNLTKKFDDFTALDSMSCRIPEGCIYGMVGSNGAGKSTFLRLVAGIYQPDSGEIRIDGEPVYENPRIKELISFVPDDLYFLGGSVSLNRMADLYRAAYPRFDRQRYEYLTTTFGLDPTRPVGGYSKGMKRQAAVLLALSCRPKYMLFDETFDGLDPVMRSLVKTLIVKDVLEEKATAIITSHSLRELEDTCDQLALLHRGGVVLESDILNLKTSLFKLQIAFSDPFGQDRFDGLDCLHYSKRGSVATLIVRGDRAAITSQLTAMQPLILDVLPLTLEEVFTYELEVLGYHFDANGYDFEGKGGVKA